MAKPKRALKQIPTFKSEGEEQEFWARADSTEYVDWNKARPVRFPNLRPSSTAISVRLSDTLLVELKLLANERDVPYQSLLSCVLPTASLRSGAESVGARRRSDEPQNTPIALYAFCNPC